MNARRGMTIFFIACAGIIWLFNGAMVVSLVAGHTAKPSPAAIVEGQVFSTVQADSALRYNPTRVPFQYSGDFEPPFKSFSEAFEPPVKKKAPAEPVPAVKLVLKGVLLKQQPLAILEDEGGKTYICGVGEKVKEQLIEKIESNRVTLKNIAGSYTLTVKE